MVAAGVVTGVEEAEGVVGGADDGRAVVVVAAGVVGGADDGRAVVVVAAGVVAGVEEATKDLKLLSYLK